MDIQDLYSRYLTDQDAAMRERERSLVNAPAQPFSGARQPERSTMGIASPYDIKSAEIARQTLPEMAKDVGMLVAGFAPGSGEYLSAKQSAESTAKAREAFEKGNYLDASAHGVSSLVNAVGTIPLLHQGIALGKGLLTGGHMLMAGAPFFSKLEHTINAKMGGKSSIDDLVRMAKNNGVSDAEINSTIRGLEGTVTKQQALDAVRTNQPEFKDVVLGEPTSYRKQWQLWDKDRNEILAVGDDISKSRWENDLEPHHEIRTNAVPMNGTHFSQYTEPGAVEGSYREMFVTAPGQVLRTHEVYKVDNSERPWRVRVRGEQQHQSSHKTEAEAIQRAKENDGYYQSDARWQDGHSQYDDIENPVVRIRFNDRDVDGKKVLFVEEMQGPSNVQQEKMPEELRNRIYDIGTKRVLNYAKENGYDGVAWTTGDMQANRYDLSKHVDRISLTKRGDKFDIDGVYDKNNQKIHTDLNIPMGQEGVDYLTPVVGKEMASRIVSDAEGKINKQGWSYSGLDLKVGGEGIKSLYDKILPSMFKKYGKDGVGTIDVGASVLGGEKKFVVNEGTYNGEPAWWVHVAGEPNQHFASPEEAQQYVSTLNNFTPVPVHYMPITDKTPKSFPKFADGGEVSIEDALAADNALGIESALAANQGMSIEDALALENQANAPSSTGLLEGLTKLQYGDTPPGTVADTSYVTAQQPAPKPKQQRPVLQGSARKPSKPLDLKTMVTNAADKYKIPRWLAHGVADSESGYSKSATSRVGAAGVMQLMPDTAKAMGVTNVRDPLQNINAGVKYLSELIKRYNGDYRLALAAYNAGPTKVDRYGDVPPFKETQDYVNKVYKHKGRKYAEGGRVESESAVKDLAQAIIDLQLPEEEEYTREYFRNNDEEPRMGQYQTNGLSRPTPSLESTPYIPDATYVPSAFISSMGNKYGPLTVDANMTLRPEDRIRDLSVTIPVGEKGKAHFGAQDYRNPYVHENSLRAMYNVALGNDKYSPYFGAMVTKSSNEKNPRYGASLSVPFAKGGLVTPYDQQEIDNIINSI